MNSNPIRMGFIGTGRRGRVVLKGLLERPELELVALCDSEEENLLGTVEFIRTMREQACMDSPSYGAPHPPCTIGEVPRSTDWREVLACDDLDGVVIATPSHLHTEMLHAAFERKLHVYCEKPLAPTLDEVYGIARASREAGVVFQTGLQMRYSVIFQKVREIIDAGLVGTPQMIYLTEFRQPFSFDWQYDAANTGGSLSEKNIHHFDLFNWYADAKPVRVFASAGQDVVKKGDIHDNGWVVVEYDSGARAMLGVSLFAPTQIRNFGLVGSKGFLRDRGPFDGTDGDYALELIRRTGVGATDPVLNRTSTSFSAQDYLSHTQFAFKDFAASVREGREPLVGIAAALEATLVCFAAEQSAHKGRVVELEELRQSF